MVAANDTNLQHLVVVEESDHSQRREVHDVVIARRPDAAGHRNQKQTAEAIAMVGGAEER